MTQQEMAFPEEPKPKTIPERIMDYLAQQTSPRATHEFPYLGTNEPTISARLRELAAQGKVIGNRRQGKAFKEWQIAKG